MYHIADEVNGIIPEAGEFTSEAEAEVALAAIVDEALGEHLEDQIETLLLRAVQLDEGVFLSPADSDYESIKRICAATDRRMEATKCAEEAIRGFYGIIKDD